MLEAQLHKALECDQLGLEFQPQVALATGTVIGSRRCRAGIIRNAAWCRPTSSSRSPRSAD